MKLNGVYSDGYKRFWYNGQIDTYNAEKDDWDSENVPEIDDEGHYVLDVKKTYEELGGDIPS